MKIQEADKEDSTRWDALPFHEAGIKEDMSYCELGKRWRKRTNGKRISELMLLNAHGRMPAQKKKSAVVAALSGELKKVIRTV